MMLVRIDQFTILESITWQYVTFFYSVIIIINVNHHHHHHLQSSSSSVHTKKDGLTIQDNHHHQHQHQHQQQTNILLLPIWTNSSTWFKIYCHHHHHHQHRLCQSSSYAIAIAIAIALEKWAASFSIVILLHNPQRKAYCTLQMKKQLYLGTHLHTGPVCNSLMTPVSPTGGSRRLVVACHIEYARVAGPGAGATPDSHPVRYLLFVVPDEVIVCRSLFLVRKSNWIDQIELNWQGRSHVTWHRQIKTNQIKLMLGPWLGPGLIPWLIPWLGPWLGTSLGPWLSPWLGPWLGLWLGPWLSPWIGPWLGLYFGPWLGPPH